jgi:NTE family protein
MMGAEIWKPVRHRHLVICLTLLLLAARVSALGQQPVAPAPSATKAERRPRIGLVLSGGGARGLAHIGVLKWLEEHRIPVDYIAGTSMGALVGAMYSMGRSPEELEALVKALNWEKLLSGPPSYDELSFRRKEDRRASPTGVELGGREGLQLPPGISSGHYVELLFDRLTLPYSTVNSFDELPIPFACVASDMLAGEPVVLRKGPLTLALRATMAIPGVFTPIEIDGRVLADGGLLDNIPTDVAKEIGAEVIITVNVSTPLGTRKDLNTLPGMLRQVIDVATSQNDRRNLKLADFVITPDLGTYTTFDFNAAQVIVDLGYKGAEAESQRGGPWQKLSLDDQAWRQYAASREAKKRMAVPIPEGLLIAGVDGPKAREIEESLSDDTDVPLRPDHLERRLSEIRGGGRYESLGYDLVRLEDSDRLRIRVREKTYAPPLIIPVFQIRSEVAARVDLSAGFRVINFDVGGFNSELRTDVIVGSDNLVATEYFKPLGRTAFFISPRAFFSSNRTDLYREGHREAEYLVVRGGVGFDVGYVFNRRAQLRVGYELSRVNAKVDIGSSLQPNVKGSTSSTSARFVYDGQDSVIVPTGGVRVVSDLSWYFRSPGAPRALGQAVVEASDFKSVSERGVLFGFGGGGTTFAANAGPVQQFTLGGLRRLSAFGRAEFRGDHFVYGGAGYLHRIASVSSLLIRRMYVGGWYEGGSAFFRKEDASFIYDGAGALIMQTPLGPLTFGGALGTGGRGKAFFSFGRSF